MQTRPRPLVAGNWKMNGLRASLAEISAMARACDPQLQSRVDLLICPPATLLASAVAAAAGSCIMFGGQDCHADPNGAHTGDLAAEMLADAGATHVIVGHSERRTDHAESDTIVHAKASAARRAGLVAVVCVGETEDQRRAGSTLDVIGRQLEGSLPDAVGGKGLVLAYEPVWAIGSGLTPTPQDVAEVHGFLRQCLVEKFGAAGGMIQILYGGSVKPGNAAELMAVANVDGALVGGASLKASDFIAIAGVYRRTGAD